MHQMSNVLIAETPNNPLLIVFGFMSVVTILLYIFREKRTRLPETTQYNYEGSTNNPKLNEQIKRNAYLHTLAPSNQSLAFNIHAKKQKKGD